MMIVAKMRLARTADRHVDVVDRRFATHHTSEKPDFIDLMDRFRISVHRLCLIEELLDERVGSRQRAAGLTFRAGNRGTRRSEFQSLWIDQRSRKALLKDDSAISSKREKTLQVDKTFWAFSALISSQDPLEQSNWISAELGLAVEFCAHMRS